MANDEINEEKAVPRDTSYPAEKGLEVQPKVAHIDDIETVQGPLEKETAAGSLPRRADSHDEESLWMTVPEWRKNLVLLCLFLGLFLSTLDTSIVATALITILTEFNDFARSEWIVVAYLLTYMSLAVAFARLSDVYGRKTMVVTAWVIFTAFSIGCGASQSIVQLIVCRAFQGIGGSGMFSLTMVMIPEVVSPGHMGLISGLIGMTLGCSGVLGPVLGGVISNFTTWRWIFFINIPLGCFTIATILLIWPITPGLSLSSWAAFQSLDLLGILLIIAASCLHIWAFESAGVQDYEWSSPTILAVLIVSASCWVTFVGWELYLEHKKGGQLKPLFPFRIVKHRVMAAAIVNTFLTGFPYISTVIMLPERSQIVNSASSLMAGVYLLPLLGASAIGSYLGGAISSKKNFTAYTLITSSILQLLGCGLLSTLGGTVDIVPKQYLFEVIFGLGVGLSLSTATILTSVQAERGDIAAAQGAVSQIRVLGGIIGVTVATTLFNTRSYSNLSEHLSSSQLDALRKSPLAMMSFPPDLQVYVRAVYAEVFSQQMRVLMYVCAAAVIVSCASWERRPPDLRRRLETHSGRRPERSGREDEGG